MVRNVMHEGGPDEFVQIRTRLYPFEKDGLTIENDDAWFITDARTRFG